MKAGCRVQKNSAVGAANSAPFASSLTTSRSRFSCKDSSGGKKIYISHKTTDHHSAEKTVLLQRFIIK